MAKRSSIGVSVTPQQADFLNSLVRGGEYQSVSEAVRAALRLFQHRRAVLRAEIERARGKIAAGVDDLDQGRFVEGEVFFREWDADLDEREEASRLHTP